MCRRPTPVSTGNDGDFPDLPILLILHPMASNNQKSSPSSNLGFADMDLPSLCRKWMAESGQSLSNAPPPPLNDATIGPMREAGNPRNQEKPYSRARPNGYKYHSRTPDAAAVDLPLVIEGEIQSRNLCRRVVYELTSRGITQQLFAEKVLGLKQSTFSEILNTPKNINTMKNRGRISYEKMVTWINLNEEEKKKVLEGKMAVGEPVAEPEAEQPKKMVNTGPRTNFSPHQLSILQNAFTGNNFPSRIEKENIAVELDLSWNTVNDWFNNKRKRDKQMKVQPVQP